MTKISNLKLTQRFRPALEFQDTLNGRIMDRKKVYRLVRVFPQAPYTHIAKFDDEDGFYSLPPTTPVIYPREPIPLRDEVLAFVTEGRRKPKKCVGLKMLWDGSWKLTAPPRAQAVARCLLVAGKKEMSWQEARRVVDEHFETFYGRRPNHMGHVLYEHYKKLAQLGIIEVIYEEGADQRILDAGISME